MVVWKVSRLGRSLKQLIEAMHLLEQKGVELWSLYERLDTAMATARARGRIGGRRRMMDAATQRDASHLRAEVTQPITEICKVLSVSRATFYGIPKYESITGRQAVRPVKLSSSAICSRFVLVSGSPAS